MSVRSLLGGRLRALGVAIVAAQLLAACGSATLGSPAAPTGCRPISTVHYTEYCIPSHADAMTTGPDGALWFTERNDVPNANIDKIGRLTMSGRISEFPIPSGSWYTSDIIVGSDGALWFTGYSGAVGRMTTSGAVKMYSTGTIAGILGLTRGPDGAVWFTDGIDIDRVTIAGAVTVRLGVYLGPSSITTGPDGALWGLATDGDVQRIETSHVTYEFQNTPRYVTTEYALRHALFPGGITTGSDGALWFVESDRIGRITTSGAISEYPVTPSLFETGRAARYRSPSNIVVGADGALWFEISGNRIGRVTTAGSVTEYPIPSTPTYGITVGPDGAIWFPVIGDKIGRLSA